MIQRLLLIVVLGGLVAVSLLSCSEPFTAVETPTPTPTTTPVTTSTPTCWSAAALSNADLASLVVRHFPNGVVPQTGENIRVTAYAVARAESAGNPSACGDNSQSIGIWQIHMPSHPEYSREWLFNPDNNADAAVSNSGNGLNWNPWCTWEASACNGNGNEAYKAYLSEARMALGISPTPKPTPSGLANSPWPVFHHDLQHTGRSPYTGPTSARVEWTYTAGSYVNSSPAIGTDGTVYTGSEDGKLYAISPEGSLKWSYLTGGGISSPAIGADGSVYVGSSNGRLYAITSNGLLKWSNTLGGRILSSPALGDDGTLYVGSENGSLYAINLDSGSSRWSYTTGGHILSSPAIGTDGTVYVGSWDNKLYALDPNGSLKWSFTADGGIHASPAIGVDGTIYVGSQNRKFYALNTNGSLKWSFTAGNSFHSSPAIGVDGTVYVGSWDNKLYALNPNGSLKWSYATGAGIQYSSPAVGADGTIYVGSADNKLYAINPNGSFKWSYVTGGGIYYSSPAIGADGTIYVGSSDGKLYAIGGTKEPTIDGTLSPGEWNDAAYVDFTVTYPNATVHALRLYAKNDDKNLYMAVTAQDTWLGYVLIRFDKNKDGVADSLGDDYLFIQGNPAVSYQSYDGIMVNSYGGGNQDTVAGGTNDVTAAASQTNLSGVSTTVFELMRTLDTKDDMHDIILHTGETVSFRIGYSDTSTIWPKTGLARLTLSDSLGVAVAISYP